MYENSFERCEQFFSGTFLFWENSIDGSLFR